MISVNKAIVHCYLYLTFCILKLLVCTVWVFLENRHQLHGFILIFTPGPKESREDSLLKESNKKGLHEPLTMTSLCTFVELPPRWLKLIFTPDPAKPASLRLEMYSLGPYGKLPSRGLLLIFTQCPKESNKNVLMCHVSH